MHHLGHLFLAPAPPAFQFGAFIADGVRSATVESLPLPIQAGIRFHRWVDWQTDRHPAFLAARRLLRPYAGRYAGLIIDLWLDVILGENWAHFSPIEPLGDFAERFIKETLHPRMAYMPTSWGPFVAALQEENLLLRFATRSGMLLHLERFIQRRGLPLIGEGVRVGIQTHEEELERLLLAFWQEAYLWRSTGEKWMTT